MNQAIRRACAAGVAVLTLASIAATAEAEVRHGPAHPQTIDGSWIVDLAPGVRPREARAIADQHGGAAPFVYAAVGGFAFHGSREAADRLAEDPRIRTVEPDIVVSAADHDKLRWRAFQKRVLAHRAFHDGHRGQTARVAVLDSGVADHRAIPRIDRQSGRVCASGGGGTFDGNGHGTRMAGTVRSVALAVVIVPIRVFESGTASGSLSNIMCGINHVTKLNHNGKVADNIDVANLSLAGAGTCGSARLFCRAITKSVRSGTAYTAAAGNAGANAGGYLPASHPSVITVSALKGRETLPSFSNFGGVVDLIAPGVNIRAPQPDGGFTRSTGTSPASALVAGSAAILKGLHPEWTAKRIVRLLQATGRCPDGKTNGSPGPCQGQGAWASDPDGITEPLPNVWLAGRNAREIPFVEIRKPTQSQKLRGLERIAIKAGDQDAKGQNTTADLRVRWRVRGPKGATPWSTFPSDPSGRYATNWNSNSLPDGNYRLVARARDDQRNKSLHVINVRLR